MDLFTPAGEVCPVCGGDCKGWLNVAHFVDYPFLPGGVPRRRPDMPDDVVVTDRIIYNEQLVALPGDRINAADAKLWGVGANGTQKPQEPKPTNAEKTPAARTRAHAPGRTR